MDEKDIKKSLDESFDREQAGISEDLIARTLKAVSENESPHITSKLKSTGEPGRWKCRRYRSWGVAAAALLLVAVGICTSIYPGILQSGQNQSAPKEDKQFQSNDMSSSIQMNGAADAGTENEGAEKDGNAGGDMQEDSMDMDDSKESITRPDIAEDNTSKKIKIENIDSIRIEEKSGEAAVIDITNPNIIEELLGLLEEDMPGEDAADWSYRITFLYDDGETELKVTEGTDAAAEVKALLDEFK